MVRKRIFEIIELSDGNDTGSRIYDLAMMFTIALSLIPLAFKETNEIFTKIDYVTAGIFVIDYLLRFATADYKIGTKRKKNKSSGGGGNIICYIPAYAYGDN